MFRLLVRGARPAAARQLSTLSSSSAPSIVLYEYDGNKRFSGLTKGLGGVGIYLTAKTAFQWYTGTTGTALLGMNTDAFSLSPFEIAAFGFVLSQQYIYLRKLVSTMTVSEDKTRVAFNTFNFLGQPRRRAAEYNVNDLELRLGADDRVFIKPRLSKKRHEYFILQRRDAKIEQLFSAYETL